jgi:hypothetical protein
VELLGFFVQEFEIRSALVLNVLNLIGFVLPVSVGLPLVVIFLFVVIAEIEILFFGSLFAICYLLASCWLIRNRFHSLFIAAGNVWKSRTMPCNNLGQPC